MTRKSVLKFHTIASFFEREQKLIEKGENSYNSSHVKSGLFDQQLGYIQGKVHASMKNKHYDVNIHFDDKGSIKEATCNCPRGQVRCHHMAALLLYCLYNVSVTDVSCSWSARKPMQNEEPVQTVEELYPPKREYSATLPLNAAKRTKLYDTLTSSAALVGFSWMLSPEPEYSVETTLESFIFSTEFENSPDKKQALLTFCLLTEDKIKNISRNTIGQSKNPHWLIQRKHRLTASNFGIILKACKNNKYSKSLFKTISGSYSLDGVKAINWGKENEAAAIKEFEDAMGSKVTQCGLILHKNGLLGASPDGEIIDEGTLVEVKCPYKYRNIDNLEDVLKTDKTYFLSYNTETGLFLPRQEHNYYHQIQGQLHIAKKSMCNFIVWTPHTLIAVQIHKDDEWASNLSILTNFYVEKYIPYLLMYKAK